MLDADMVEPRLLKPNRRRSLGALLRIPLSTTRAPDYNAVSTSKPLGSVPTDIIREVVDLLSPADILNFSLTSSTLRALLIPALYETVTLKSSRKCRVTLTMLSHHPDICAHIHKFVVRPNYYLAWPKSDEPLEEEWVARMIEDMAGDLTSMDTFDWDGLEMPPDQFWGALRKSCPNLRNISSNIGAQPLDPDSQLFDFSNLTSFSLIVRYGLEGSELFPTPETLPKQLWNMLVDRCPDLEEVAICSFSSSTRNLDFLPITRGRWPQLSSLTLGSFGYQSDFSLGPAAESSFTSFLNDHPTLEYIRFQWNFKRWMSPSEIPMHLSPQALPVLDTFIGIFQQLAGLPNPGSIEALDLTCEPLHENRMDVVSPILRSLVSLSSLDIWMHVLGSNESHVNFFNSVLSSCPNLTDLHFMCTTTFTGKPFKELITHLKMLPHLKRFSLTKGHRYGDDAMLTSALQILRYNPALQQINIRWARESSPNHLKQEGTYDVLPGKRVVLAVHERGIPLIGRPFSRQYKYYVRRHRLTRILTEASPMRAFRG